VQVSAGAVDVLDLQGRYLRDTQSAACHEPEEGRLSGGESCSEQPVPFV